MALRKRLLVAFFAAVGICGSSVVSAQADEVALQTVSSDSELTISPGEVVNVTPRSGQSTIIERALGDVEPGMKVLDRAAGEGEQAPPACLSWYEAKGFTQVKNDCEQALNVKVYYASLGLGLPGTASGCETVAAHSQHNIGFVGYLDLKRKVERVVICSL